jgi:hypothetical protein
VTNGYSTNEMNAAGGPWTMDNKLLLTNSYESQQSCTSMMSAHDDSNNNNPNEARLFNFAHLNTNVGDAAALGSGDLNTTTSSSCSSACTHISHGSYGPSQQQQVNMFTTNYLADSNVNYQAESAQAANLTTLSSQNESKPGAKQQTKTPKKYNKGGATKKRNSLELNELKEKKGNSATDKRLKQEPYSPPIEDKKSPIIPLLSHSSSLPTGVFTEQPNNNNNTNGTVQPNLNDQMNPNPNNSMTSSVTVMRDNSASSSSGGGGRNDSPTMNSPLVKLMTKTTKDPTLTSSSVGSPLSSPSSSSSSSSSSSVFFPTTQSPSASQTAAVAPATLNSMAKKQAISNSQTCISSNEIHMQCTYS